MYHKKIVIGLLCLAILLRLAFIFGTGAVMKAETVEAGVIAQGILIGKGFSFSAPGSTEFYPSAIQAPVYPILLAGLYSVFGISPQAHLVLILIQTLLSLWLCYLIYQMGVLLFNETVGLLGMLGGVFYPIFIIYSGKTTNTMISIVAVAWFFYQLFYYFSLTRETPPDKIPKKSVVLLGLSAGMAVLSEPIMLSFLLLFSMYYLVFRNQFGPKKQPFLNLQFKGLFLAGLIALAVVLPWTIRNYMVFHQFIPVRTMYGLNLLQGNNPLATGTDVLATGKPMYDILPPIYNEIQIPEPQRDKVLLEIAKQFIRENPGTAFHLFLKKCYYFWWFPPPNIVSPSAGKFGRVMKLPFLLLIITAVIGTGMALKKKQYYPTVLFWMLFMCYMLVYGMTHSGHFRYRAPIEPYLILLAGYAVSHFVKIKPKSSVV
jgi:hypothetical protein